MTNTMRTDDLLRIIDEADVMVSVNGSLGFVANAVRVPDGDWIFFVLDDETRAPLGEIKVAPGAIVEIVEIRG